MCLRLSAQAVIDSDRLRSHVYGRYDPVISLWYMPWQDKAHVVKDINLDISVRTGKWYGVGRACTSVTQRAVDDLPLFPLPGGLKGTREGASRRCSAKMVSNILNCLGGMFTWTRSKANKWRYPFNTVSGTRPSGWLTRAILSALIWYFPSMVNSNSCCWQIASKNTRSPSDWPGKGCAKIFWTGYKIVRWLSKPAVGSLDPRHVCVP